MPELFESGAIEHDDPQTQPSKALDSDGVEAPAPEKSASPAPPSTPDSDGFDSDAFESPATPEAWSQPQAALPHPAAVPELVPAQPGALGAGAEIKVWKFLLILVGVWIPAAAAGLGLYYWWYISIFKTWPLFVLLVLAVGCTVGGVLLAMVVDRPLVSALAIAVMSATFAALIAAAVLHGAYYFQWIERPG